MIRELSRGRIGREGRGRVELTFTMGNGEGSWFVNAKS